MSLFFTLAEDLFVNRFDGSDISRVDRNPPIGSERFLMNGFFQHYLPRLLRTKPIRIRHDPINRKISAIRLLSNEGVEQAEDRYKEVSEMQSLLALARRFVRWQ